MNPTLLLNLDLHNLTVQVCLYKLWVCAHRLHRAWSTRPHLVMPEWRIKHSQSRHTHNDDIHTSTYTSSLYALSWAFLALTAITEVIHIYTNCSNIPCPVMNRAIKMSTIWRRKRLQFSQTTLKRLSISTQIAPSHFTCTATLQSLYSWPVWKACRVKWKKVIVWIDLAFYPRAIRAGCLHAST